MKINLFLSCRHPLNWNSLIKIINAHKPNHITFCHYDERDISELDLKIPEPIIGKFSYIEGYEHINMKNEDNHTAQPGYEHRLDVRMGASFSQIMIKEMVGSDCKFFSTSYDGTKLVRLDEAEQYEVQPIDQLELLRLSGSSYSYTPVSSKPFNFEEFIPKIIEIGDQANLNSEELVSLGIFDSKTMKVRLTDSDGNILDIDSRENHGFWYEDIVMRKLAINFAGKKRVFANVTRNQKNRIKQIRMGLKRVLKDIDSQTDYIINELSRLLSTEINDLDDSEINAVLQEVSIENLENLLDNFVFNHIFAAGAKNEFDGMLVDDRSIETIEIKTTSPNLKQARKLETFSRYHSPVKGSRMYLVTNFITSSPYYDEKSKKLRRNLGLENIDVYPIGFDNLFRPNQ